MLGKLVVGLSLALAQTESPELGAQRHLLRDWAGLTKYGSDDSEIKPPRPGERRVIFFGDDVVEHWTPFFPGQPYINRGMSRQITPQLLVRFRQDVIALRPKVVVIEGGANDIAGIMGGGTPEMMADHFMSMVELAKVHGIGVVLGSVLPGKRRPERILEVNSWLKDYCAKSGIVYADFYSVLANERNFKKEYTDDGSLPNGKGYALMSQVAEAAIEKALATK